MGIKKILKGHRAIVKARGGGEIGRRGVRKQHGGKVPGKKWEQAVNYIGYHERCPEPKGKYVSKNGSQKEGRTGGKKKDK